MSDNDFDILNRHLIIVASCDYGERSDFPALNLDESVSVWKDWLTAESLGERRFALLNEDLAKSPPLNTIEEWIRGSDRIGSADAIVAYVAGHGKTIDGIHRLAVKGSNSKRPNATMIQTSTLIGWIRETRVKHALVVIDACEAAAVVVDLARVTGPIPRNFCCFASTSPAAEAYEGKLAQALKQFLDNEAFGSEDEPFLKTTDLANALTKTLEEHQLFTVLGAFPSDKPSPCLPNPRYRKDPELLVTAPARRDLASRSEDLSAHREPRRQGVPTAADQAWLFRGRDRLMADLVKATRTGAGGVWLVTGSAGCGKSAVLSRLVTLSDPKYADENAIRLGGIPPEFRPDPGAVDVAILATGRTGWEVIDQLHGFLCPDSVVPQLQSSGDEEADRLGEVAAAIRSSPKPACVVIDALDEAQDPQLLITEVLAPLVELVRPHLKLIVGMRSIGEVADDISSIADDAVNLLQPIILPADRPPYWVTSDLVDYLSALLVLSVSERPSPYADDPAAARWMAEVIAGLVGTSFVLGRVVAVELASRATVQDPGDDEWRRTVQGGLKSVLRDELQRAFPKENERQRVVTVLGATAIAFGRGLPWRRVWPAVASALASDGTTFGDSDISQVLRHRISGYLIRELDDTGTTVYRPFHEAVQAALLGELQADLGHLHRRITSGLAALITRTDFDSELIVPEPYVRRYLIDHAAAGGLAEKLLSRAEFVVTADPRYLAAAVFRIGTGIAPALATTVLNALASYGPNDSLAIRAGYLVLEALKRGRRELASAAVELARPAGWLPLWAIWGEDQPGMGVARLDHAIRCIAFGAGSDPVIAAAAEHTVLVCRARDGLGLGRWAVDEMVSAVDVVASQVVLATRGSAGRLAIYDTSGRPEAEIRLEVNAVAARIAADATLLIAVAAYADLPDDRYAIRLYRYAAGSGEGLSLVWELAEEVRDAYSVAWMETPDGPHVLAACTMGPHGGVGVLISVRPSDGEIVHRIVIGDGNSLLNVAAAPDEWAYVRTPRGVVGCQVKTPPMVQGSFDLRNSTRSRVSEIDTFKLEGRQYVITAVQNGFSVLDAADLAEVGHTNFDVSTAAVGTIDGIPVVATGNEAGEVKVLHAQALMPSSPQAALLPATVANADLGVSRGGGLVLCRSRDNWTVSTICCADGSLAQVLPGKSSACCVADDYAVIAYEDGITSKIRMAPLVDLTQSVWEVDVGLLFVPAVVVAGDYVVIAQDADDDGSWQTRSRSYLTVLDRSSGRRIGASVETADGSVRRMSRSEIDGRCLILSAEPSTMHFGFWLDELLHHCLASPPPRLRQATYELLPRPSRAAKFLAFERGRGLPKPFFVFDEERDFVVLNESCLGFEASGRKTGGLVGLCQLGTRLVTIDAGGALALWEVGDSLIPSRIGPTVQVSRDIQSVAACGTDRLVISSLPGLYMLQLNHAGRR
ncbi:ATP-binding protein [Mycobacterium angelicum]|uniref:Orc1-like AAA ATPase domain-containing protein n=1 Tax=Mycobacterium angelicum TaxID=470074 RepID=A0A1W9ZDJ1_MYCAN|nr:ATP-binding protein [Mycobacterium angelicum]MCV7198045.1 ATP-binding protein [Mycobacterium angelicum]ORA12707.1 hypothetical protein BST12_24710 [Mycobacterium angelicum]